MSHSSSIEARDAVTAEELEGIEPAPRPPKRNNAFAELMSRPKKPKLSTLSKDNRATPTKRTFDARDGLSAYIEYPEHNPEGLVVEYDNDWVVIQDKYPKASVHLLLIPRSPALYTQHPLNALSTNSILLETVRTRVAGLKLQAAAELRRQYGTLSTSDAPYQIALANLMDRSTPPPAADRDALLPPGRDWHAEIMAGVHTHPSMNHMHIHILSRESHSPCVKHKKHYLSFHSSFFVELDEFPLHEDRDRNRFHPGDWPNWEMQCWKCGKSFGNKFAAMKRHLEEEFEVWKRV